MTEHSGIHPAGKQGVITGVDEDLYLPSIDSVKQLFCPIMELPSLSLIDKGYSEICSPGLSMGVPVFIENNIFFLIADMTNC